MFYLIYYKESTIVHRPFKALLSLLKFVENRPRRILGIHSDGMRGYTNTEFKTMFGDISESSLLVLTKTQLLGDPREGAFQTDLVLPNLTPLTEEELLKGPKIFRAVPFDSINSIETMVLQHMKALKKSMEKEEKSITDYLVLCEDKLNEYHANIVSEVLEVTITTNTPATIKTSNDINHPNELTIKGKELRGIFELINEIEILRGTTQDNYRLLHRIRTKYNIYN